MQFLADLTQLGRHRLHQVVDLSGDGLAVQRERTLHLLADGGKLLIRAAARGPQHDCDHYNRGDAKGEPYERAHRFIPLSRCW